MPLPLPCARVEVFTVPVTILVIRTGLLINAIIYPCLMSDLIDAGLTDSIAIFERILDPRKFRAFKGRAESVIRPTTVRAIHN
jgi:hypothetical protein